MTEKIDRLTLLERQAERVERRTERLGVESAALKWRQLVLFVLAIVGTSVLLAVARWLGGLFLLGVIVVFIVTVLRQRRVDAGYVKDNLFGRVLRIQLARLKMDWQGIPLVPFERVVEQHPFEHDLDITGERSLLHLINTGVSFEGIQLLASWLLNRKPDLGAIRERQAIVRELTPLTRFRHKLSMNSLYATRVYDEPLDGERLISWLEKQMASQTKQRLSTLQVAIFLSVLLYTSVLLFVYVQISALFCVGAAVLCLLWFLLTRREQGDLATDAGYIRTMVNQLRVIFEYLEKYPYAKQSRLGQLCAPFYMHQDRRPSILFKKLGKTLGRASLASSNEGWTIFNILLPVGAYTAYQLDRQKALLADYLPQWLHAWYELEALSSLANFAYLNPDYVMPEIITAKKQGVQAVKQDEQAFFKAVALGHPLIARNKKVVNTIDIDHTGEIVLITGSNMSGKSTFLRTIGINLVLAYAGSVVNAESLQTSLFEVFACIKVTDLLADGYSYFYAEVRRLRQLLVALERNGRYPLFFLIDEIFRGTNNYERLIGSVSYIQALLEKRCVGAISTHDLDLVKLADTYPAIRNMHFREDIVDGTMVFDYILRAGPSPTRNALRIMQMEGLPIKWDAADQIATKR